MSSKARSSASNGIWLCRNHGTAVDAPDTGFTVETLRKWQHQAYQESRRKVLFDQAPASMRFGAETNLDKRLRAASAADLEIFRRTVKWPSTTVPLILKIDSFDEPVTTTALARAATMLDDLILIAPPGMGKTTTLFQVAEGLLANEGGAPFVIPLGDWASNDASLLDSLLRRPALHGISEEDFRTRASKPGVILILDGWNELDGEARKRARVQVEALEAELPELGFVISTRKQASDVPFTGEHIKLLPLNNEQQIKIATALRGEEGVKIIDRAKRTPGVRELIALPLYLTTLLSLPKDDPFPATKEELLRLFVSAHERDAHHAEVLFSLMYGFHGAYLEKLAVFATEASRTAIADSDARRCVSETATMLIQDGQIASKPQPGLVLDGLVSNHLLMRAGDAPGYMFQHQQFQEWFASHFVERQIMAALSDPTARDLTKSKIFNFSVWEEAILFAVERLARGDANQRNACAKAIIASFEVDPMLAAEMIFRATDDVWLQIATEIIEFVNRWHAPGKNDRALRFMLTTGRPEFCELVWPLVTHEDEQKSLVALRHCRRFRATVLGRDAPTKIKALPSKARGILLHEIAINGGIDGLDFASAIAKDDPDPEVQVLVIDALSFRLATNHTATVLRDVEDETLALIVERSRAVEVDDARVRERLAAAVVRQTKKGRADHDRLDDILYAPTGEDRGEELAGIIGKMELEPQVDAAARQIFKARNRYPSAVVDGLLSRVRAGRALFYGTDDILAAAGLGLDDDELLQIVLADPNDRNDRADAAASVLGSEAAARLLDEWLDVASRLQVNGKYDQAVGEIHRGLEQRIAHLPGMSIVEAVLKRSANAESARLAQFASLLRRHPIGDDRDRPYGPDALVAIQGLVVEWGARMLATGDTKRAHIASVATLASCAPSANLLPVLQQLLDEELRKFRSFRQAAADAGWRQGEAVNEARIIWLGEYQLAFQAIPEPETAVLMRQYLTDEHFGPLAAQVLANQWRMANTSKSRERFIAGVDFSQVKARQKLLSENRDATSEEAETILSLAESLSADGGADEQKKLALALGIVAADLPHGRRAALFQRLTAYAPLRTRADLLTKLVLSGEEIDISLMAEGIAETFKAAEIQKWILTQSEGYELKRWICLLPFVSHPLKALSLIRDMPPAQRDPHFLEELVRVISDAPSREAEELLFILAKEDPRFYANHVWQTTAFRLATLSSAHSLINLVAEGAFVLIRPTDDWHFVRQLGALLNDYPVLRDELHGLLEKGPSTPGLAMLAGAVAQCPDENGLLLLVKFQRDFRRSFIGWQTVESTVTQHVPSENWKGAYEVTPRPASGLRKRLMALMADGNPSDPAARLLNQIDKIRDRYGTPEGEPRHPDLQSGQVWPILIPDPDASDDG